MPLRDGLRRDDPDRVAVQAQPGDQPGVVEAVLVEGAARHDLPSYVAAGRLADADERIALAAEVRVDGGDRVDAVGAQQVRRRADRPVLAPPAFEDLRA